MLLHSISGELVHPVHLRNVLEEMAASPGGMEAVDSFSLTLPLLPSSQGTSGAGFRSTAVLCPDSAMAGTTTAGGEILQLHEDEASGAESETSPQTVGSMSP